MDHRKVTTPNLPPGVTLQKKGIDSNLLANLNIPKGVTIQPPKRPSITLDPSQDNQQRASSNTWQDYFADYEGEEEFDDDADFDENTFGDESMPTTETGEDFFGDDNSRQFDEEDEGHYDSPDANTTDSQPVPSNVILPPGVTLARKKSTQHFPPNIQLPPGVSLGKTNKPTKSSVQSPNFAPRSMFPNSPRRPIRPQRQATPNVPSIRMPQRAMLTGKSPRKGEPVISDFLEQRMQVGYSGNPRSRLPASPMPKPVRHPRQDVPNFPRPLRPGLDLSIRPRFNKKPQPSSSLGSIQQAVKKPTGTGDFGVGFQDAIKPNLMKPQVTPKPLPKIPSGITLQSRKPESSKGSEDDLKQKSMKSLPKFPGGITVQPRKAELLAPIEEGTSDDDAVEDLSAPQVVSFPKTPAMITGRQSVRVPTPVEEERDEDLIDDVLLQAAPTMRPEMSKLLQGITVQPRKVEPDASKKTPNLPPGITLQRRNDFQNQKNIPARKSEMSLDEEEEEPFEMMGSFLPKVNPDTAVTGKLPFDIDNLGEMSGDEDLEDDMEEGDFDQDEYMDDAEPNELNEDKKNEMDLTQFVQNESKTKNTEEHNKLAPLKQPETVTGQVQNSELPKEVKNFKSTHDFLMAYMSKTPTDIQKSFSPESKSFMDKLQLPSGITVEKKASPTENFEDPEMVDEDSSEENVGLDQDQADLGNSSENNETDLTDDLNKSQEENTNPDQIESDKSDNPTTGDVDQSGSVLSSEQPAENSDEEDEEDLDEDYVMNEPLSKAEQLDIEKLIASSAEKSEDPEDQTKLQEEEKDVMQNLVDLMTKGEIEGEIEDDKEDESSDEKKSEKRKLDGEQESEDDGSAKKLKPNDDEGNIDGEVDDEDDDDEDEDGEADPIDKSKVTGSHLRKNIREVMDETKLDEATLAAQRQEAERLKRLQEQQRIIREVQRQIQHSKQNQKIQSKVLSLLQGNSQTSILKTSSTSQGTSLSQAKTPNSVLLKMGNGQQANLNEKMRELLKGPGRSSFAQPNTSSLLKQGMVSSSVTIAPIKKEFPEKKKVVTLSSDSDDDCIVLSDDEIESEPDEDPTNSGMHTADRYNVPDEHGRVLVNTGHPPDEPDVFLAPQIARVIKPHQIGGIRFLFDNIIESVERYNSSQGFGCILAHSMGLGKTLQIVSFSDIFLRHTSGKKILVIMPINTIQNWLSEFNMWIPRENHTDSTDIRCRHFDVYVVNESLKNIHSRGKVILNWHKNGGVLLMGYELFRLLSLKKPIKSKRKRPDELEMERNRELIEDIYRALVKPGPDLVICDEGHRIKNSHATTSQALKQIRTRRRVVLTGYPLQNNLLEYWCMVDFVRPNYLGSKTEFSNMFERPIQNGQCIDSTPQDKRLMRFRAHVLHSLLEGFVQRRSHAVLQQVLPQKEEYVLLLRFTSFQRKLYDTFMNDVVRVVAVPNPLKAFAVCCKIWNHPDVLFNFLKKKGEQIDLDLEEALNPTVVPPESPVRGTPIPLNVPWPKRGPGSRGGKIRQPAKKKAQSSTNTPPQATPAPTLNTPEKPPQSENILPSMSQFAVQSGNGFNASNDYPQTSSFPQQNYFPEPQQQQNTDEYSTYQQGNYNNPMYGGEGQKLGNGQKMYMNEPNMYPGHETPKIEQKMFNSTDFGPNFAGDMGYQGQFQQPVDNPNQYNQNNMQQQYYQPSETSSGFDYSQSTTDMNDFPQMSGFSEPGFDNSTYNATATGTSTGTNDFQQQQYWGNNWTGCGGGVGTYSGGSSSDEFMSPPKFSGYEGDRKDESFGKPGGEFTDSFGMTMPKVEKVEKAEQKKMPPPMMTPVTPTKGEPDEKKEDIKKEDVPYDWATELFKNYVSGIIENSSKMEAFFLILNESMARQDRILVFSQSLLTLDLIEEYLQRRKVPGREENWARNRNYFRLDGSTPALERERLINEFNTNNNVGIFLVSTRAGSLGINLVGANRVVVFDASWNPCHDTQAVCRVYRYGQRKPCYVYRLVMDCCLEKKIYDRQINKQGMADRVVDELNPDAHLSIKEVTNLCWDDQEETGPKDFSDLKDKYEDDIIKTMVLSHSHVLSKAPFQHESLLIDRKEKKLSQAEKRLAKRSYELEKQAANQPRNLYQIFPPPGSGIRGLQKPIASVKPMQSERFGSMPARSKWISADVWQKQGMSAQEMTLPLDVVIPTNSPDKTQIVLKAGQRVMVLKSPKGIYMQLESGKIIAIRTAFKVGQGSEKNDDKKSLNIASALKNNPNVTITSKSSISGRMPKQSFLKPSSLDKRAAEVNMAASKGRIALKNRPMPFSRKLQVVSPADRERFLISQKHDEVSKEIDRVHEELAKDSSDESGDLVEAVGPFHERINLQQSTGQQQTDPCLPEQLMGPPPSDKGLSAAQGAAPSATWDNMPMGRDIAKESLSSLDSLVKESGSIESGSAGDTKKPSSSNEVKPETTGFPFPYPGEMKDGVDVKKEEDPVRAWPMNHPYGNFYPGYYGYGPMPGYEGYPYPPNYPPPIPVKQEIPDGNHPTPPPASTPAPTAPPIYPPFHGPYPYPYNYPPFPPQAQPPSAMPPPVPHKSENSTVESTPYVPPYNARPPFPSAPAPPYYPNYPPYRPPYHDPNFPYPNYTPFIPPGGYGYPMQTPPQGNLPGMVPPQQPSIAQPHSSGETGPLSSATDSNQN